MTSTPPLEEGPQRRMSAALSAIPLLPRHKPDIDIKLDDQQAGCFVPSYTTLDKIQGIASVTCTSDTPFDSVHIIFQGASKTFVEKTVSAAATSPRTQAYHNFLRLVQPMEDAGLPEDGIARAGVSYKLPFTFVVPEKLLPQACTHAKFSDSIQDQHLQLPPTLGDPMMAGDGKSLLNDLAPAMSVISYGIRVIMTKKSCKPGSSRPYVIADAMKKIRIIPATEEQPPLNVNESNDDYLLTRSRSLRKGMFKGKLGSLTMSASQPTPLRLSCIRSKTQCPTTTMANIQLRFEPADADSQPPKLGSLSAKIKCFTFFATVPMRDVPARASAYLYDAQRGVYSDTVTLASRNVESVQWTKHSPRHDSAISIPENSSNLPHYTSEILVPIDLATKNKAFVPTFHSCLISRVYCLDVNLNAGARTASVSSATLNLKLPIQIVSEGNPDARPIISAEEAASIARREADSSFNPRSVAPPADFAAHANLDLRGARGSIFQAPRWGSVGGIYGPGGGATPERRNSEAAAPGGGYAMATGGAAHPSMAAVFGAQRRGSEIGSVAEEDEDAGEEEGVGPRGERRSTEGGAPPGYSAFNGARTRPPGAGALIGY